MYFLQFLLALILFGCTHHPVVVSAPVPRVSKRAVVVLFDRLSPEIASARFLNIGRLRQQGIQFDRATVGYLPASSTAAGKLFEETLTSGKSFSQPDALEGFLRSQQPWKICLLHLNLSSLTLEKSLAEADLIVGRLLDNLVELGVASETSVVLTASVGRSSQPQRTVTALPSLPKVKTFIAGGFLRFWLKSADPVQVAQFAGDVKSLPGVIEVYTKQTTGTRFHYTRSFRSKDLDEATSAWLQNRSQSLLETLARSDSAHVVALLDENVRYPSKIDVGGASRPDQQIPLIVSAPNLRDRGMISNAEVRLVDVGQILARLMDDKTMESSEGSAAAITPFLGEETQK